MGQVAGARVKSQEAHPTTDIVGDENPLRTTALTAEN